jgi:hypothetical protein
MMKMCVRGLVMCVETVPSSSVLKREEVGGEKGEGLRLGLFVAGRTVLGWCREV